MPPKKDKPTNDELLAQLDDLGIDAASTTKDTPQPKAAVPSGGSDDIDAITRDLDDLTKQRPASRTGTPRVSTEPRPSTSSSPKQTSGRTSEEKSSAGRPSQDFKSTLPTFAQSSVEKSTITEQPAKGTGGGGWWGGLLSTATAAMKHAEAAVKEIQNNEEAQKWAEQVRGNVGALRGLGS
jgi:hypothetical protein